MRDERLIQIKGVAADPATPDLVTANPYTGEIRPAESRTPDQCEHDLYTEGWMTVRLNFHRRDAVDINYHNNARWSVVYGESARVLWKRVFAPHTLASPDDAKPKESP
jgi:hypothetical protein